MELIITEIDIEKTKEFYASMESHVKVQERMALNVNGNPNSITLDKFWHTLIRALLSSRQKSDDDSPISTFLQIQPFPFLLKILEQKKDVKSYISTTLKNHDGVQYYKRISDFAANNRKWLIDSGWKELEIILNELVQNWSKANERNVSNYLAKHLDGIGPKQSRNILQMIGLTKFEIPLDSRFIKWLNNFGFPIPLHSKLFDYPPFYEYINDIIINLCESADIYPCQLDAAIFASFNKVKDKDNKK